MNRNRAQDLLDASVLLEDIKNHATPNLAVIWSDLTDEQVEEEVSNIAHLHEWLGLS